MQLIRGYIAGEIDRAHAQLSPSDWQAILVGVRDEGEVAVYPCRFLLPFYYPATFDQLDLPGSEHFSFPEYSWGLRWQPIPEFAEQYVTSSEVLDDNFDGASTTDATIDLHWLTGKA